MKILHASRAFASKKSPASRLLAAMAALALAAAPAVHAANDLWIGNSDANFGTLTNWTGSVTPNGNTPQFGTAGTAGTTLNNDISGATYAGLTFNSGASAYTIGGNSFTLTGDIVNSSSSLQTINTAITINTARTFNAASGQLVLGGNITGSSAGNWTLTSTNKITLAGTNNVTTTSNGGLLIGAGAGGVDITGSTTLTGSGTNSGYVLLSGNSTTTIQSGGSLTANGLTGGIDFVIGQNTNNTTSTLVVNGGTLTVGANHNFYLGNNQDNQNGVLTISSGTATINRGSTTATDSKSFIAMGRDAANGTINLNGGTLATDRNFVRDGSGTASANSSAIFNFGGGTLKALANQADWFNSATINTNQLALSSVTTSSAASTIDANGFAVGINTAITGSGGFHITDSSATTGIVHFGGASYAYTGATSVDSGTFNTNRASVAFSGNLAVAGGKLTLNDTGAGSVSAAAFGMSSGTWTVSIGDTVSTTGNMSITGGTLDVAAFLGSEAAYTSGYSLFTSIGGTGSVSGLSITGYNTTGYTAALSNAGVLTFTAIPEPSTYAVLGGVIILGFVTFRRRRPA